MYSNIILLYNRMVRLLGEEVLLCVCVVPAKRGNEAYRVVFVVN